MTLQEDKKTAIIEKVTSIHFSEWILVKEQGKYDRYETTFNGVPIQMWACVSDGGHPFIVIYDCSFYEGGKALIAPFFRKLTEYTKNEKEKAEGMMIDEIYKKLT